MKTKTKAGLIVSLSTIVLGIGMITAAMTSGGWSLKGLFSDNRVKRVVGVDKPYTSVVVNTTVDSVAVDYSVDNKETWIELYDDEKYPYDVHVSDDTLYIYPKEENFYVNEIISVGVSGRNVVVHIGGGEYDIVNVRTGIGNIDIKGSMFINELITKTGIGDINVGKDIVPKSLRAQAGIGSIFVPKAEGLTELKTGIGNIHTPSYKERRGDVKIDAGIGKVYGN